MNEGIPTWGNSHRGWCNADGETGGRASWNDSSDHKMAIAEGSTMVVTAVKLSKRFNTKK